MVLGHFIIVHIRHDEQVLNMTSIVSNRGNMAGIDKSWITVRNCMFDQFWNGAMSFIERAKNFVDQRGLVRCPCKKCVNVFF